MCNICNNKEAVPIPYTQFRLKVKDDKIYIEKYYGDMEEWFPKDDLSATIKYCPMCGEKL